MDSWHPRANEVFAKALEFEAVADRSEFLDEVCAGDNSLRTEVDALLASHEEAGSFLEKPATAVDQTVDVNPRVMEAGLAATFTSDAAVVMGDAGHSVLKSIGKTLNRVPYVTLRGDDHEQSSVPPDFGSRYQLEGEIARGGMGAILKGRDADLGRDLAIKVLLDSHKDNPDVVARFVEEAQIGGQLQHPGIVPVHELGQFADQRPFFSMKLVQGETLASMLAERTQPTEELPKFLGIFEQICQTMAYAHSRGVIHRDLKPANVMVGAFGEVQVMDWGIAKVLDDAGGDKKGDSQLASHTAKLEPDMVETRRTGESDVPDSSQTRMGSVMGTPAYMPPEQALGEINRLDERADVFGLGAILCEILSGQPPYVGSDAGEVYRQAAQAQLGGCFDRLAASAADAELVSLARDMLAALPAQRPRDAGVVAERTTGYLEGVQQRLKAAELASAEAQARAEEERRRRKLQFGIAGLILVVAIAAGIAANRFRTLANENLELADARKRLADDNMALAETNRKQLYISDMNVALEAWGVGNVRRVTELLRRHQPRRDEEDLRRFEWYYLWKLCQEPLTAPVMKHAKTCFAIALSPDGSMLASSGRNDVRIWDFTSRLELARFRSDPNYVWYVCFSPDGQRVAAANHAGNVKIWNVETTRLEHELTHPQGMGVVCVKFSADGRTLASSGHSNAVYLWDALTGELLDRLETENRVPTVTFSPDGNYFACGSLDRVTLWNLPGFEEQEELAVDGEVLSLEFSPDSEALAARHGPKVTLWEIAADEAHLVTENAGMNPPDPLAFSPDGSSLAFEVAPNTIRVWDIVNRKDAGTITHGTGVTSLAFSPKSDTLVSASAGDGTIKVWDLNAALSASLITAHTAKVSSVSMSPDGKLLATAGADHLVKIWNTQTWTVRDTIPYGGPVTFVQFSRDGDTLVFGGGSPNAPIILWDPERRRENIALAGHSTVSWSAAFSPDGRYLATSGELGLIKIWDLQNGGQQLSSTQAEDGPVRRVAYLPDGKRLVSGSSKRTRFWRVDGASLSPLAGDYDETDSAWAFAFSPNGKLLASGGRGDPLVFWNVDSCEQTRVVQDGGDVRSLEFSADGKTLASVDHPGLRLWEVDRYEERIRLPVTSPLISLAMSPDNQVLVGGLADGSLQIWRAATEQDVSSAGWWASIEKP